jgi:molecular chaperone GrpE
MTEASISNPQEEQPELEQNSSQEEVQSGDTAETIGNDFRVEELEKKTQELNDKLLRAVAEAQNTKRRAQIDIENSSKYAIERFARDMITVLDNLYRAAESINNAEQADSSQMKAISEGIELTKTEMVNALGRNGIERVEPIGQPFDHNVHQAMAQIPSDKAAGTVIDVMQAGYTIKGRLLRPALVAIAKAAEAASVAEEGDAAQPVNPSPRTQEF